MESFLDGNPEFRLELGRRGSLSTNTNLLGFLTAGCLQYLRPGESSAQILDGCAGGFLRRKGQSPQAASLPLFFFSTPLCVQPVSAQASEPCPDKMALLLKNYDSGGLVMHLVTQQCGGLGTAGLV